MTFPVPEWLTKLEPHKNATRLVRNRYFIRAAALYHSPQGRVEDLAASLGVAYSTVASMYAPYHGVITVDNAIRIENLVGREILPRELLRPDIFIS